MLGEHDVGKQLRGVNQEANYHRDYPWSIDRHYLGSTRYESDKVILPNGTWRHTQIRLVPLNPEFKTIVLPDTDEEEAKVIAEWVEVLTPIDG